MTRFLLGALAVAGLITLLGIMVVDLRHERRLAAGEPMSFGQWTTEMSRLVPPTSFAPLLPAKEGRWTKWPR